MGTVMINCPATGQAISTKIQIERSVFARTPVFFTHTYGTICSVDHGWFARDAWVEERQQSQRSRGTTKRRATAGGSSMDLRGMGWI